jgi:nicotinamidase-related amidase
MVLDKPVYSAFGSSLVRFLSERQASGVIVTGGETDVCVLATILDAVDLGYRTYVVADALCSSSDPGHDAVLTLLNGRYSQQVAVMNVEALCSLWPC